MFRKTLNSRGAGLVRSPSRESREPLVFIEPGLPAAMRIPTASWVRRTNAMLSSSREDLSGVHHSDSLPNQGRSRAYSWSRNQGYAERACQTLPGGRKTEDLRCQDHDKKARKAKVLCCQDRGKKACRLRNSAVAVMGVLQHRFPPFTSLPPESCGNVARQWSLRRTL